MSPTLWRTSAGLAATPRSYTRWQSTPSTSANSVRPRMRSGACCTTPARPTWFDLPRPLKLLSEFATYRVPRFRDVPKLDVILLDRKDLESAGAGETPIIAIAPAIANAVFDATGKRVHSMPIRAPRG